MTNNSYYIYINTLIIKARGLLIGIFCLLSLTTYSQNQLEIQLAQEYLLKGEKRKALELFRELAKNDVNLPFIQNSYLSTLLDLSESEEAISHLKKLLRKEPNNILYRIDIGIVYMRIGDTARADKYFRDLINEHKSNTSLIVTISNYFASKSLVEYAVLALLDSRNSLSSPTMFCVELAMLYRIQGQRTKMVQEYLSIAKQSSVNIQFAKNLMQAMFV